MSERQAAGRSKRQWLWDQSHKLRGRLFPPKQSSQPSRAQSPASNPDVTDSSQEDNMWEIAEVELRKDPKKNQLLDAFYDILKSESIDLDSSDTSKKQEQISAFIKSKSKSFEEANKSGQAASVLKNAAGCILKAKEIISTAAQPCLPASIACAGAMFVLSLYVQASSQKDFLFKGLNEIPHVIYRLAKNEDLHWTKAQEVVVKESMTKLCSHIIEFLARAACHLKKNPIAQKLKDMFRQGEWDVLLSEIKNAEAHVRDHSIVIGWMEVRTIKEDLEKDRLVQQTATLHQKTEARRERVSAFLTELHEHAWPGGDSYTSSKDRVKDPEEGTCKWFTNHDKFKEWESPGNPDSRSPLLLLTAYPGSGKSVLSKHLINAVLPRSTDRAVCYFFFKDDFEHQKSATGALCTLLHQLLAISESRGCTPLADSALRHFKTVGKASFFGSVSSLWKTFTETALHPDAGEIICVLDALDECRQKDRNELIDAINDFYRSRQNKVSCLLKVFLTSRPYGDIIQSKFSYVWGHQLPEIRLAGEEDDVANDIEKEIKIVVDKRIDHICDTFHLAAPIANLMKTNLGTAPGRTYLWITLVFDDLLKNTSTIDKNYIENFIKNPPKNIDDAYEKILSRLKTQGQGNQDLKRTQTILQMVVAARRPLTLQEMSIALPFAEYQPSYQVTADDIEMKERMWDIIRDCCGLLVVRVDDRLYLLHQTVREFLVPTAHNPNNENRKAKDTPDSGTTLPYYWKHSIDLMNANSVLAKVCIFYLHSNFAETNDSLLDYSANYWVDHYHQSAKDFQAAEAARTTDLCLLKHYREWVTIYGEHNMIPEDGPTLCFLSALGLEGAIEIFLLKQYPIKIDFRNDLEAKDKEYGQTPLLWAARNGHTTVVEQLLEKGADPEAKDKEYGRTPLSWAARRGNTTVVEQLLEKGADLEAKNEYGQTPLSLAAESGHTTVVKQLLEKGADLEAKDKEYGRTPLLWAAQKGYTTVVKQLLEKGADLEAKDKEYGQTPLLWAARSGSTTVVEQLLEKGADLEAKDEYGQTPLLWAAQKGYTTVVEQLLEKGADLEAKDEYGKTPLSLAADNGHTTVVEQLLEKGADLEAKDKWGLTPLSWAAENGHTTVVEQLLEKGTDLEAKNKYGQTPLLLAAASGNTTVVEQLLEKGADLEAKDKWGQTPLSWAAENGHTTVVEQLRKKGTQRAELEKSTDK